MKKIVSLFLFCFLLANLHAQRGRVQIQNGTVVTDRGTLLRGARISTDGSYYMPSENDIAGIKDLGLNSIHIYAECPNNCGFAGQNAAIIDSIVNMTESDSLYLVMTIGNCGDEGSFDSAFVNEFWKFYAPRYKNKTHVVYEINNEPFPWSPPYDTATLAMERRAYDTIRYYAPETHILFMTYSWPIKPDSAVYDIHQLGSGVDWSNASIAAHSGYYVEEDRKEFMRVLNDSGYAVTYTEPGAVGNKYISLPMTRDFEAMQVSYLNFIPVADLVNDPTVFVEPIESSEVRWNPDFGTWPASLTEIKYRDPYQKIEAGFFDEIQGIQLHVLKTIAGYINNGDYLGYYNFDFEEGPDSLIFECSAGNLGVSSGSIELILDSLNGTSVGVYPITHTDDWDDYQNFHFPITTSFKGVRRFYFVFHGDHQWDLMNLKSFQFKQASVSSVEFDSEPDTRILIYPNPARYNITIQTSEKANLEIYSMQGQLLLSKKLDSTQQTIPVDQLKTGNYIVRLVSKSEVTPEILIIK
jgi:hypothetical protein